jgi:uncharacterized protein YbjT (DUF2867 family)
MGQRLVPVLLGRGHRVRVLARAGSEARVPAGAETVPGNPLDAASYAALVHPSETLVHLVGTPHPSPAKAAEFNRVDLPSIEAAVQVALRAGLAHLVYVSVAHPAPVMKAYIEVRSRGEAAIRSARLTATVLRPWYVLGPGHWWPVALMPMYAMARAVPSLREGAQRLGLVTIDQMVGALLRAVENPPLPNTTRVVEVPEIRAGASGSYRELDSSESRQPLS